MSWFKELTSKAEAILVKLDQDAALALQNSDGLLPGLKQTDQDFNSSFELESTKVNPENSNITTTVQRQTEVVSTSNGDQQAYTAVHQHTNDDRDVSTSRIVTSSTDYASSTLLNSELELSRNIIRAEKQTSVDKSPLLNDNLQAGLSDSTAGIQETSSETHSYSKKFTIQTSKVGSHPFVPSNSKRRDNIFKINGNERPSIRETPIENLGADDIRASINRSLQEYTNLSPSLNIFRREIDGDSAHNTHFDNQPNLVRQTKYSNADEPLLNRSSSSTSFSIDVPEDRSIDGRSTSNDIAARLLKSNMSKRKKSTFYLHQVINRLANPNESSTPIFSDQTRIKLRRAQMRLASSVRRLNYYLQAYPIVKYLILIQLVIMQLLVIYVLFFYQSSGSASELSSQIKKQQQELAESQ